MAEAKSGELLRIDASPLELHAARQTILACASLRDRANTARDSAEHAEKVAFANEDQLLELVCAPRSVDVMSVAGFWTEGEEIVFRLVPIKPPPVPEPVSEAPDSTPAAPEGTEE